MASSQTCRARDAVADAAQEFGEYCLAAFERLPPEVRAIRFDQVESAQDGRVVAKPVAQDVEDREASSLTTMASPSITHDRTGRLSTAATIFGYRAVKSEPFRVASRMRSLSRRARMRKPSCLIS